MPSQNLSLSEIAYTRIDTYPNRPTIVFLHDSLGCIALWRDFPYKVGRNVRNAMCLSMTDKGTESLVAFLMTNEKILIWKTKPIF